MLNKDSFLNKYNIDPEKYETLGLDWKVLEDIKDDYEKYNDDFSNILESISRDLRNCSAVHSIRSRVKNSEHIVEKLIRKKLMMIVLFFL